MILGVTWGRAVSCSWLRISCKIAPAEVCCAKELGTKKSKASAMTR